MARIVLTTWGSYGDINPYMGIALALRALGHEPVLAAPDYYRSLAQSEGIAFHAVRPEIDPGNSEIVARVMHPRKGPEVILRELMLPSVEDAYEDLQQAVSGADLLVSHPITFAAPLWPTRLVFLGFPVCWRPSLFFLLTTFRFCRLRLF
jgi:rhamnosyltransferase subunit B